MHFGERLKMWREAAGYTTVPAAVEAYTQRPDVRPVAVPTWYGWETLGNPTMERAFSLMDFFAVADPADRLSALESRRVRVRRAVAS
jgi:hypothetical protein